MARSVDTPYLDPRVLGENVQSRATPLAGIRRFFQADGAIVFASEKAGIRSYAEEVWVSPATCRQLGTYLDMVRPYVVGWRLSRLESVASRFAGVTPGTLWDDFVAVATATRGRECGRLSAFLSSSDLNAGERWPWRASICYEHVRKLARGQRTMSDVETTLYARPRDGRVDLALVVGRPEDVTAVDAWLSVACRPDTQGWLRTAVSLPPERERRTAAVTAIVHSVGGGPAAVVGAPSFVRLAPVLTEVATTEGQADPSAEFVQKLRSSNYDVEPMSVHVAATRLATDEASIAGLNVYAERRVSSPDGRGTDDVVVSLRLRQNGERERHLALGWQAGRYAAGGNHSGSLTLDRWDKLRTLEWPLAHRRQFLLDRWIELIDARFYDAQATASALA